MGRSHAPVTGARNSAGSADNFAFSPNFPYMRILKSLVKNRIYRHFRHCLSTIRSDKLRYTRTLLVLIRGLKLKTAESMAVTLTRSLRLRRFDVNPQHRPRVRLGRTEVADKPRFRAQFDMAGIVPTVNDHRADRGVIGIAGRKSLETIPVGQFDAGFTGPCARGSRLHDIRGEQRVLHVGPAVQGHLRMRALAGDLGGPDHPRVVAQAAGLWAKRRLLLRRQRAHFCLVQQGAVGEDGRSEGQAKGEQKWQSDLHYGMVKAKRGS